MEPLVWSSSSFTRNSGGDHGFLAGALPSSSFTRNSGGDHGFLAGALPSSSFFIASPLLRPSPLSTLHTPPFPFLPLALQSPKGFGSPPPPSKKKPRPPSPTAPPPLPDQQVDDGDDDAVPEIVTNRMLKRMAFTVGIPLGLGVLFFPFFYYLKVGLKLDLPEWIPFLVSGLLFGSSAFGISYGILSTSWDPLREGSVLGWKEAKANWPLFFQRGKQDKK